MAEALRAATPRATLQPLSAALSLDAWLLIPALALICIGVVAIASASVDFAAARHGNSSALLNRHLIYLGLGCVVFAVCLRVPMQFWARTAWAWLLLGLIALVVVLMPGIGREVNGSQRWLGFGPLTLQPSEFVKLGVILYLADYCVRRQAEVREQLAGFIKPVGLLVVVATLLLLEPDFGTTVVIAGVMVAMLFLSGVRLRRFLAIFLLFALALGALMFAAPYRIARLTAYTDPWADQFNSGYQLTQALIAFGRGEWFGVGLGQSIQKLFYLPEAHTDFVFAIWGEEQGLLGAAAVVLLFSWLVGRLLQVGWRAERAGQTFSALTAYGIGILIGGQAFINIGVNTGLLPTKGLTLPFISYGGSSTLLGAALLGLALRIQAELPNATTEVPHG